MAVINQQQPQDAVVEDDDYSAEEDQAMGDMLDDQAPVEGDPAGEQEPIEGELAGEQEPAEEENQISKLQGQVEQLTNLVTMMTGGAGQPGGLPGSSVPQPHQQPAPAQPQGKKVPTTPEEILEGIDFDNAYADPDAMRSAFDTAVRRVLTRVDDAQAQSTEAASSYYSEQQRANRFYEDNPDLNTDTMRPIVADTYRRIEGGYHARGFVPTQDQILQETATQLYGVMGKQQGQPQGQQ